MDDYKKSFENNYADLTAKLKIDCEKCSGLCCVALYCMKTDGFPANKEAGKSCEYLTSDFRCRIHSDLADKKYKGCLAYDCFGAGQKTTQLCLSNGTWKTNPGQADKIYEIFMIVFQLHQMLWYLVEASTLTSNSHLKSAIDELISENEQMTQQSLEDITRLNLSLYRSKVNAVLKQISRTISAGVSNETHSTHYFGKDFRKANLDRRDFSMSLMIAANFEGCSLRKTNFLGADIRDANLKNTDLSESIFLTQMQINSAKGNSNTKLPTNLSHPVTWKE